MVDREKVIKGLGCCISGNIAICKRVGCPYAEEHDGIGDTCIDHLMADALALLKAQEPRVPIYGEDNYIRCGKCKHNIVGIIAQDTGNRMPIQKFCAECGQAVKWK